MSKDNFIDGVDVTLTERISTAEARKPAFGEPCNHCGWCCLTEVCQIGEYHGASGVIPCSFIEETDGDILCSLVVSGAVSKKVMCAGTGCCAITQAEIFKENGVIIHRGNS